MTRQAGTLVKKRAGYRVAVAKRFDWKGSVPAMPEAVLLSFKERKKGKDGCKVDVGGAGRPG